MTEQRGDAEACVSRLLARRDHSTGELRAKLAKRDFAPELIDEVISDLVDRGWVNDRSFARHQAQILADRGWGPTQIRTKLVKHGVERDMARETLGALGVNWVETARNRIRRKFSDPTGDDRERAYRHLTYRGFSADTARRAIFDGPAE